MTLKSPQTLTFAPGFLTIKTGVAQSESHLAFQVYLTHLPPLALGQRGVFEAYKTWAVLTDEFRSMATTMTRSPLRSSI